MCVFRLNDKEQIKELLLEMGRHNFYRSLELMDLPVPKHMNRLYLQYASDYVYFYYDYPALGLRRLMCVDEYDIPKKGWRMVPGHHRPDIPKKRKKG